MRVTKILIGTFLAGVVLEVGVARLCAQSTKPSMGSRARKTAEQVYKNIQVLKGVPADQLIPAMQFITASLGVQCDFCHLENAFEKDDKETKQTARKMMRMMFAINKDNFDGHREVTCYACHRGAHKPVITPVLNEEEAELVAEDNMQHHQEASAASLPSADQILGKYLLAIGGADAAARVSTRIQKGTLSVGSEPFPVEILAKAPDKRVTTVHFPGGDSVIGVNGQEGWLTTPGRPVHEMSPPEVDAAIMDAELFFPASLKQTLKELRVERPERLKGREAYVLSGIRESLPTVLLYFDQESGLLVRALHFVETPLGRNPTEIDYADYREGGGLKTPFRWTVARSNGRVTIQVEQSEQNVPIDDGKFVKPAVPASTELQRGPS